MKHSSNKNIQKKLEELHLALIEIMNDEWKIEDIS